ncbi:hypothetical protein [Brevundimonas sp.]|uniref:hypothetical protein n=1 Tax=Brevundimonas sp. TaxID=1871086 RepID=UPI00286C9D4F|nr:hypothetical protein [Brevundimonas sp.]
MTGGLVRIGNRRVQRFVTPPQEVRDGTVRCIACGQVDEAPYHDNALCPATRPHGLAARGDHEAVCAHAETSDDPVVTMLRDADDRLSRPSPDVHGARVGIHAARLAVSSRILVAASIAPASKAVLLTAGLDVSADRIEIDVVGWRPVGGEVDSTTAPPHWTDEDRHDRHPKTSEEWNWRNDPPLRGGGLDLAVRRLNFAGDIADPRAPDQMALVLRKDLINLKHELITQTARASLRTQAPPEAGGEDSIDLYDPIVQRAISWTLNQVGRQLGAEAWTEGDGSESVEGDVACEIANIMRAANMVDPDGEPLRKETVVLLAGRDIEAPLAGNPFQYANDPVQAWLQARCLTGPACLPDARELARDLYDSYCAWCAEHGVVRPLLIAPFGSALKHYGILSKGKNNRGQHWRGPIRFRAAAHG